MPDRQPYLHNQTALVAAPLQVWSRADGDIDTGTVGVVFSDVQLLNSLRLTLDGHPPTLIGQWSDPTSATFVSVPRHLQDETRTGPDPSITVTRTRTITAGSVEEHLCLESALPEPAQTTVSLEVSAAATPIDQVKRGVVVPAVITTEGDVATWHDDTVSATLTLRSTSITGAGLDAPGLRLTPDGQHRLRAHTALHLPPGGAANLTLTLTLGSPADNTPVVAVTTSGRARATQQAGEPEHSPWLQQSLDDLESLRLEHRSVPGQPFFAAGAPWYLTLFGRDSLWAARLLRPLDPTMTLPTLRVLAALQGRRHDPDTEEAPGKILHEIRSSGFTALPARYYGSIDATSLWVNLLVEAWEAGNLSDHDLEPLLPALSAALDWITGAADSDGDGFAEYIRPAGRRGLANQGWKDSPTSIQYADGTLAAGPIALTEVQGYAYQAAHASARLLHHCGLDPDRYLTWADQLRRRFHQQFLLPDGLPALALDGHKNRVDATTSNIGHLLGTNILDSDQEHAVADRLTQPDMDSGLGLRTMSTTAAGYHPLSYHCGSVWAHDTAIVINGMLHAGLPDHARQLAAGLQHAATAFHNRLPELWSGYRHPLPYPAACRPQAWAAAAAIPAHQALTRPSSTATTLPSDRDPTHHHPPTSKT